jgi:hypothetical protein
MPVSETKSGKGKEGIIGQGKQCRLLPLLLISLLKNTCLKSQIHRRDAERRVFCLRHKPLQGSIQAKEEGCRFGNLTLRLGGK